MFQWTQFPAASPDMANPTGQLAPRLLGSVEFADGSCNLKLSEDQVAVGWAEIFEDAFEHRNPPFTLFVIYGATDITVSLKNGGWDIWENASEAFIQQKISEKVGETKELHANDFASKGYRVIRCYSQVTDCETVLASPQTD